MVTAGSHIGTEVVFPSPFVYLIMAPKSKSRDAGNSDMPEGSHGVLFLSEKVEVLNLLRKKKMCWGC